MTQDELQRKLAAMTRAMEDARAERNAKCKKIYHQTNPERWEELKKVLGYKEPAHDSR